MLIAIGVDWEGQRNVLAVELANRESQSSWKEFCLKLKTRSLNRVEPVMSDDHAGLRKAILEVFTKVAWQRCYVHFLRNAVDHLPRKGLPDRVSVDLLSAFDRRGLAASLRKWAERYPKRCDWVEGNIEATLSLLTSARDQIVSSSAI